jgi:hypothetical protein
MLLNESLTQIVVSVRFLALDQKLILENKKQTNSYVGYMVFVVCDFREYNGPFDLIISKCPLELELDFE